MAATPQLMLNESSAFTTRNRFVHFVCPFYFLTNLVSIVAGNALHGESRWTEQIAPRRLAKKPETIAISYLAVSYLERAPFFEKERFLDGFGQPKKARFP
jgi:hypothetical protein